MHAYEVNDPHFVRDLRDSQAAVWFVAQWLQAQGQNVTVRAQRVRPDVNDMAAYADAGDIELVQRVEVKQRRIVFTGADDYPYRTVTVDVAHAWDRAQPKPVAYYILNLDRTAMAIVDGRSSPWWERVTKPDRFKGRDRTFYECPVQLACFVRL